MLTLEEQEAESAIRQMLDNFSYGMTRKTMAVFLRVLAEYLSKLSPDEVEEL